MRVQQIEVGRNMSSASCCWLGENLIYYDAKELGEFVFSFAYCRHYKRYCYQIMSPQENVTSTFHSFFSLREDIIRSRSVISSQANRLPFFFLLSIKQT